MPVHLKEAILSTLLSESTGNPQIHQTHTAKLIHLSARPVVMAPNMKVAPLFLLACAPTTSAFFMPAPLARLPSIPSGSFSTTTSALSRVPVVRARGLHMSSSPNEDEKSGWELFTADLAKKFTVAAAVAAVALSAPGDALAARSGGRMGGRSFSSPSRSYAPSPRSYSPSYGGGGSVNLMPIPVPMGGGMRFGYPSFGVPGVSFYGGGFGLSPVDILLLGGVAYGLAKANQGSAPSFGNMDNAPSSSLGEGVDVLKLQVALNSRDRSRNSILGVLADLSERGDTESRTGLASVVSEISLALARKQVDWIASASELEHFNNRNTERAEATFSQYAVRLRTKIERETRAVIGGKDVSTERASGGGSMGGSTVAVVSIVLALRGDQLKRLGLDRSVNSVSGLRAALEMLAAGALSDDGENVLAAEVLWTPEEPWEVLTREDAIADFPELLDI